MDKWFHPSLHNECDVLSILGLKLSHVSKRGHSWSHDRREAIDMISFVFLITSMVSRLILYTIFGFRNQCGRSYCDISVWHVSFGEVKNKYNMKLAGVYKCNTIKPLYLNSGRKRLIGWTRVCLAWSITSHCHFENSQILPQANVWHRGWWHHVNFLVYDKHFYDYENIPTVCRVPGSN